MKQEYIKNGNSVHLIGIGGIGMSGLAQMLKHFGMKVTGSDRAAEAPENKRIFDCLKNQGIKIFPQDGSFIKEIVPDAIVYSTAIENDNPDFKATPETPRTHRAEALAEAMRNFVRGKLVAVTGSCGKTTVTSWLAEILSHNGKHPSLLAGGLGNAFAKGNYAGNFFPGNSPFIFEADESDKSLTAYSPDYALILNTGTDHYSKQEQLEVFTEFLGKVKKGAVIEKDIFETIKKDIPTRLNIKIFSQFESHPDTADWTFSSYSATPGKISAVINGKHQLRLPAPGIHTAANACAVSAMLNLMGVSIEKNGIGKFSGVWRRFDYAGKTSFGTAVYDDYAHNVEKIISCLKAAKEVTAKNIIILFQPHGFGPLGFMKDELFKALENNLGNKDIFAFLPVFYAGGTTSFNPTSEETVRDFTSKGVKKYKYFDSRKEASRFIVTHCGPGDTAITTGARDNSLSDWSRELAGL